MERGISDRSVLDKFAEDFCSVTEKHVKYIVVSGYVAIAHGRFRTTEDIDMITEKMSFEKFAVFHHALEKAGFHCMQSTKVEDIYEYLEKGDGIRYVRKETFLPPEMEIKFAKDELDELQIETRRKMPFTGLDVWFSSVEMNIAFKEELLKSPKDMEDARHLRKIYKNEINPEIIEEIKEKIKVLRLRDDKR